MIGPIALPDLSQQDAQYGSNNVPVSEGTGLAATFENAFDTNPTSVIGYDAESLWDKYVNPGAFVDHDDIPTGFKGQFPNGASQNELNLTLARHNKQAFNNDLINRMPTGFASTAAQWGVSVGASLLDPVMDGVGAVLPEAFGAKVADAVGARMAVKTAIGDGRAAKLIGGAVAGSLEGATFGAPMAVANFEYNKSLGNNPDPWDILTNTADMAMWGGGLHGIASAFSPINQGDRLTVAQTAANQVVSDKQVNVDALVQQSMYNAATQAIKNGADLETHQARSDSLGNQINSVTAQLDKLTLSPSLPSTQDRYALLDAAHEAINNTTGQQILPTLLRKKSDSLTDNEKNLLSVYATHFPEVFSPGETRKLSPYVDRVNISAPTKIDNLQRGLDILRIDPLDRSTTLQKQLTDLQNDPEMNRALNVAATNPSIRSTEDQNFLNNFVEEESEASKQYAITKLKQQKNELSDLSSEDMNNRLSELDAQIQEYNNPELYQTRLTKKLKEWGYPVDVIEGATQRIQEVEQSAEEFAKSMGPGKGAKRLRGLQEEVKKAKSYRDQLVELNDDGRRQAAHQEMAKEKQLLVNERATLKQARDISTRIDKLSKQPAVSSTVLKRNRLLMKLNDLQNMKDHEDGIINFLSTPPVNPDMLRSAAARVNSEAGDAFLDAQDARTNEALKETVLPDSFYQERAQELVNRGVLDQEAISQIESQHAKLHEDLETSKSILDKVFDCLRSNNG